MNRKSNAKFNPKATLQKIKQGSPAGRLDQEAKKALVSDYLEVSNPLSLFTFTTTHIVQLLNQTKIYLGQFGTGVPMFGRRFSVLVFLPRTDGTKNWSITVLY